MMTSLLNLIWPLTCPACATSTQSEGLCSPCAGALIEGGVHACPSCAGVYLTPPVGGGDHRCGRCLASPPPWDQAVAGYAYGGPLKDAIVRWKSRPDGSLSREMGRLMLRGHADRGWEERAGDRVVCPVPSPLSALRARGFNPAGLLARELGRRFDWPLIVGLRLRRTKGSSKGLGAKARARRLRGLFYGRPDQVAGRQVVLVDDVMTSGATAHAATRALLRAGAQSVDVALLARAPLDP